MNLVMTFSKWMRPGYVADSQKFLILAVYSELGLDLRNSIDGFLSGRYRLALHFIF